MGSLTPAISGTMDGELVRHMTNYVVNNLERYVEDLEIVHRNKFINKRTGWETTKHTIHATSGNDVLVDLGIHLVDDLPRAVMQQLTQLAKGVLGAGMEIDFRDDWVSNYIYSTRWVNAAAFAENTALLCSGTLMLEAWDWAAT